MPTRTFTRLLVALGLLGALALTAGAHPRARKKSEPGIVGETLDFQVRLRDRDIRSVAEDDAGVIWAIQADGSFLVGRPGGAPFRRFLPGNAGLPYANYGELVLFQGAQWLSTRFSGLVVHAAGSWQRCRQADGLSSDQVTALAVHDQRLWVATRKGLDVFVAGSMRPRSVPLPAGVEGHPSALSGSGDRLLVGTSRGQVLGYDLHEEAWTVLCDGPRLSSRRVQSLIRFGNHVWVGTFGELLRLTLPHPGTTAEVVVTPGREEDPVLGRVVVTDLVIRRGELWLGTLGTGLLRRSAPRPDGSPTWHQYLPPYEELPSDRLHEIFVTRDDELLLASTRGVGRVRVLLERQSRIDVAARIPRTDVPEEIDLSRPSPAPRLLLRSQAAGGRLSPLAALGRVLFEDPNLLGEAARRRGISCGTCHPAGHMNTNLFVPGHSRVRGGVDLTSTFLAPVTEDGLSTPMDIPSLRGVRLTPPYGRRQQDAGLRAFLRHMIVVDLGGPEPRARSLDALVAFCRELDFLPSRWLTEDGFLLDASPEAARRGEALFRARRPGLPAGSCAACHPPHGSFTDGRLHDVGTGGSFDPPSLQGALYAPPYMHDGRFADLRQVVDFFDRRYDLGLAEAEKQDLVAYLEAVGEGIGPYRDE